MPLKPAENRPRSNFPESRGTISLAKHRRNNINPLSLNSDQHQFSLNNIHMLPRGMVMRVNKMITKEKIL